MMSDFRALIVAAVSSERQAADDRGSLEAQLTECRAACARNDWHVVKEIVLPGQSRSYFWLHQIVADSPEYAEIVQAVESHLINLIVCWRYDRLWRGYLQGQIQALCAQHGVQIYSTQEPILPKPPSEKEHASETEIIQMLSGWQARREINTLQARRRLGMAKRIRDGKTGAYSTPPYGYVRSVDHNTLEVDPSEAVWVQKIYEWRAQGWGYHAIRRQLAAHGVPPPATNPHRPTSRKSATPCWLVSSISKILQSPTYTGEVHWGSFVNPHGNHQPIVTSELWERVQAINEAYTEQANRQRTGLDNEFARLVRCGFCGYAMARSRQRDGRDSFRCSYYLRSKGEECRCNSITFRALYAAVYQTVRGVLCQPELFRQVREEQGEQVRQSDVDLAQEALTDRRARLERVFSAYEAGAMPLEILKARSDALTAEVLELENRIQELTSLTERARRFEERLPELRALIDQVPNMEPNDQRAVFGQVIKTIRVRDREIEIIWW